MKNISKEDLQFLVEIGFVIPFNANLRLFHGRIREKTDDSEWKVISGYETDNDMNVYLIPVLSTGDKQTAEEFSIARKGQKGLNQDKYISEVHKIVSNDPDALIINKHLDYKKLNIEQKRRLSRILVNMGNYHISELSPAKFEDRDIYLIVYEKLKAYYLKKNNYLSKKDIEAIYNSFNNKKITKELVTQIAGALNAKLLLVSDPVSAVQKYGLENWKHKRDVFFEEKGKIETGPLNFEYVASWLHNNHIVGIRSQVTSATIDKGIIGYYLFDLDKINTEKEIGDRYQSILNEYGPITKIFAQISEDKELNKILKEGSSKEIIEKVCENVNYEALLDRKVGLWEGFTVKEHTETVLRVFEDTYFNSVPTELLPFIKIAMINHDLMKRLRFSEDTKKELFDVVLSELGIKKEYHPIISFVINESQRYTTDYYVGGNKRAKETLYQESEKSLYKFLKRKPTKEEIRGLMGVCEILQTCDSAAYTRYAVTRDERRKIYYKNGNDGFTDSFEKPTDIRGRKVKWKRR